MQEVPLFTVCHQCMGVGECIQKPVFILPMKSVKCDSMRMTAEKEVLLFGSNKPSFCFLGPFNIKHTIMRL